MFSFGSGLGLALVVVGLLCRDYGSVRLLDGSWCWVVVGVGIGGLSGVKMFGWKGVGNLGIGMLGQGWGWHWWVVGCMMLGQGWG